MPTSSLIALRRRGSRRTAFWVSGCLLIGTASAALPAAEPNEQEATSAIATEHEPTEHGATQHGATQDGTLKQDAAEIAPLSVAPLDHVQYPQTRPGWVSEDATAEEGAEIIPVSSGLLSTAGEAEEVLAVMTQATVRNQLERLVEQMDADVDVESVAIDPQWVESELVVRRYHGTATSGGETKYEAANLVRLEDEHRERLTAAIRERQLTGRLAVLAIGAAAGFSGLVGGSIVLGGLHARQRARPA